MLRPYDTTFTVLVIVVLLRPRCPYMDILG